MLEIANLNQYYGESHTLWDIHLNLPKGVCTCLMGRNGAGKTTLLKSLMGLHPIKTGQVNFDGTDITHIPTYRKVRLGIGYVPQGREIFSQLTVEENLRLGLTVQKQWHKEIPDKIYDLFPDLKKMLNRRGGNLSGGQQQQLSIARALVANPKFLILDEPTEGIQPNIVHQIGEVIEYLCKKAEMTILLVEQKLAFARRTAQHFCIMDKGYMVAADRIDALDDQLIQKHLRV